MKIELKITYECPACKQINEDTFHNVVQICASQDYIGSGEYVPTVDTVEILCTGCKVLTPVKF
jgi:phage FluMu protein Com